MLDFAEECNRMIKHTQLSIVDVLPEEDIKTCQQIADERGYSSEDTSFFELGAKKEPSVPFYSKDIYS